MEEGIDGVKIINRSWASEEAIKQDFETQGWTWIEKGMYLKMLAVTASRFGYPDHELIAVKDKFRFYHLFHRPKQKSFGMQYAVRDAPNEWKELVESLRITYAYNFKSVVDEVRRRFPSVPEKDIVDYIIGTYIGKARLRKAVYKPENRLVHVWSISQSPTNFLVEGIGIRNFADLSFAPVDISNLEKTGMLERGFYRDELKRIISGYRSGYMDAVTAIENIIEIVEMM